MSSGRGGREIVPHGLVDNGVRWHVRAFDRKSREFRDFVFTRMERPVIVDGRVAKQETGDNDAERNRIVELEFVPHPRHKRPEVIRREYGMVDGVQRVRVRAVNAGYMLRLWNIDCSSDHRLDGPEYML
jgi:predicted DNA-binding transcriptional regulator YafY